MTRVPLPHTPKRLLAIPGNRALDEATMAMILALTSEVTILRARLDACERLLVDAKVLEPAAVDGFVPDAAAQVERDAQRNRTLAKVMRPLSELASQDLAEIETQGAKT